MDNLKKDFHRNESTKLKNIIGENWQTPGMCQRILEYLRSRWEKTLECLMKEADDQLCGSEILLGQAWVV